MSHESFGMRSMAEPGPPGGRRVASGTHRIRVVHAKVCGRARLHVAGLKGSPALKSALEGGLPGRSGIAAASASEVTGNLLLRFDPAVEPKIVVAEVARIATSASKRPGTPACGAAAGAAGAPRADRNPARPSGGSQVISLRPETRSAWHVIDGDKVLGFFGSSPAEGLSSADAQERLRLHGPNALPGPVARSGLAILLEQFASLPVGLLLGSAALSVATGGIFDAVAILGVVAINAGIGYVSESQSEKTIGSLAQLGHRTARVQRGGRVLEIPAEQVVVGDILMLTPGNFVAADARLIDVSSLTVDESALTGESMPVSKTTERLSREDVPIGDRFNMVYRGTVVTGGSGLGVVVAVGRQTEIGAIHVLVGEARAPETPMQRQLGRMGRQLALLSGGICGGVFVVGLLRGIGLLNMLKSSVALAVAAVPEGLPMIATTTLALGIRNMHRRKVLIRHLDAVETLGAVQVLCFDKTGTLTQNRMSVVEVSTSRGRFRVADGRFRLRDAEVHPFEDDELLRLLHVGVLCSETKIDTDRHGGHVLSGTATENALVEAALSGGIDAATLRAAYPRLTVRYRSEEQKFMVTLHEVDPETRLLAVKGSPSVVLAMCRWRLQDGALVELSPRDRGEIEAENERMAGEALRILGLACAYTADSRAAAPGDLVWLGLVGLADPVRSGMRELIARFHDAGIKTIMITGDQTATAFAIAKQLNLSRRPQIEIFDSGDLRSVGPEVLGGLASRVDVFARVSPANKLEIVRALQSGHNVIAMTGDGINDGPALKAADIGIAMGTSGTDVARNVADVVVEDDDLQTLIVAISQGRTIYSNIRKSLHFLLATNMSEIWVMLGGIAAGLGQPLTAMQLLWINIMTDIFPGLALSLEPPEPDVLRTPPRSPSEPIITGRELRRILLESAALGAGGLGAYWAASLRYGIGPRARSTAFISLVTAQLLHVLSCRSQTRSWLRGERLAPNKYLTWALGGTVALQGLAFAAPPLRRLLNIARFDAVDAAIAGAASVGPFLINEATKPRPTRPPETAETAEATETA
jgi:Ca2+-transporting ATPase